MKIAFIFIVLINILYPTFETFNKTYQSSLLTSSNELDESFDIQFQIGPNIEGFKEWKRTRLGFPERPIIIDTQFESSIIQVRIDTKGFLINLIPTFIIVLIVWIQRMIKNK
jgi:hypothetical protein